MECINKKEERLGEIRKNKESLGGYEMKIIEYKNCRNIIIEFQDRYKAKVSSNYQHFEEGSVKNPYYPSICEIGYIGEGKYKPSENGKDTNAYKVWSHMIKRCYDPYELNKKPTYIDCYVCEEWHNFQNFAEWYYKYMYNCNNERMHLDKDILIKGNKIYSPSTCCIVPQRINVMFTKRQNCRGKYPIGVKWHKRDKIFEVCCYDKNCRKQYLGRFDNEIDAFVCYKNFKEKTIKQVADEYKNLIPIELYDALYKYEVEIND